MAKAAKKAAKGATAKIDLYKQHKAEYEAKRTPALVTVEPAHYLAVAGRGEPGGEPFVAKIGALYTAAFTIKMTNKFAGGQDYAVSKLEGLWWGRTREGEFFSEPRATWNWKLLIRVPDFITQAHLDRAVADALKKGKPADVKEVRLETIDEGLCVQMLHVGPYEQESTSIAAMLELAQTNKLKRHGLHHEIYLSDPRRVAPEKLRTILRLPVRK